MRKLPILFLFFAPLLHAAERSGFDLSLAYSTYPSTGNAEAFNAQSVGIGLRISDPDRPNTLIRVSIEKGIQISGFDKSSISEVRNFYAASFDYLWIRPNSVYLGAGIRIAKYDVIQGPPSQFPINDHHSYGTNHSTLPQFIIGSKFLQHVSIEIGTSVVQSNIQIRYLF